MSLLTGSEEALIKTKSNIDCLPPMKLTPTSISSKKRLANREVTLDLTVVMFQLLEERLNALEEVAILFSLRQNSR